MSVVRVVMPQLGESIVEATVARWLVAVGTKVERGQPIAEVETDKATNEIPAPAAGIIGEILVAAGVTVKVGTELLRYAGAVTGSSGTGTAVAGSTSPAASAPGAVGTPAPTSAMTQPAVATSRLPSQHLAARAVGPDGAERFATPAVRRLARAHGVELASVAGSGRRGRITRADVEAAVQAPSARTPSSAPTSAPMATAAAGYRAYRPAVYTPQPGDTVQPFTRRRTMIAEHMHYSLHTAAHVAAVVEIDMSAVVKARAAQQAGAAAAGVKLTYTAFVVRAVAASLAEHPALNAAVVGEAHVLRRERNIGVAVDTPAGLVVPVIRRADELSLLGLARALEALAAKARVGTLSGEDLAGGSFTVSNPGRDGNLFGISVIRQPEVAILRTGEIQKRAVVRELAGEDAIVIRPVMFAALSYDHRVIDGATGNAFLHALRARLESEPLAGP